MKYSIVILITLFNILLNIDLSKSTGVREINNIQTEEYERKAPIGRYGLSDDSFEAGGEEDGDDSVEYSQMGPPDINAYLYGRSLRKGFNSWAGRRDLEHLSKNLKRNMRSSYKRFLKLRQRRKPWGGSA